MFKYFGSVSVGTVITFYLCNYFLTFIKVVPNKKYIKQDKINYYKKVNIEDDNDYGFFVEFS